MNNDPSQFNFSSPAQKWLHYSFLALMVTVPWSLSIMQIALVSLVVAALWQQIQVGKPIFDPLYSFFIVYWLLRLTSALVSPSPTAALISVLQTDWVMLTIPLLINMRLSERQWQQAATFFMASITLAAAYGLIQYFEGIEYFRGKNLAQMGNYYRATGGFSFYLTFGANQMMGLAFLLGIILSNISRQKRIQYILMAFIVLLSIFATFARSAWLAMGVVIAVVTLMTDKKLFWWGAAGFLGILLIAAFLSPELMNRITSIFDPSKNEGRLNLWHTGWNMMVANPIWGIGPGQFNTVFELYKVPGFYDADGHAHNDLINMAANSGIPTMISWMAIWVYIGKRIYQSYFQTGKTVFQRSVLRGSLAAICGILLAGIFQCYYTDLENNIFWWVMAVWGLNRHYPHE